jgi:hypothetical protein
VYNARSVLERPASAQGFGEAGSGLGL